MHHYIIRHYIYKQLRCDSELSRRPGLPGTVLLPVVRAGERSLSMGSVPARARRPGSDLDLRNGVYMMVGH